MDQETFSDHCPVVLTDHIANQKNQTQKCKSKLNYSKMRKKNRENLQEALSRND